MQQDSSGFFNNITTSAQSEFNSLELIYSSEDGFNVIYKATKQNKRYILKALKTEYAGNPIYESLLVKEFEISSQLEHPNIGQSYGLERVAALGSVIVEEYIDGVTLDEYLNNNTPSKDEINRIVSQICDALSYAHKKQIIHRDLKPQNIMVTHNGANVKLIDFGLADSDSHIAYKDPAGTPSYSSPEQMAGEEIDLRSDIYSLGVILSKFDTNARSPQINRVIKRCCNLNREERYLNCEELKRDLTQKGYLKYLIIPLILTLLGVIFIYNNHQNSRVIDMVEEGDFLTKLEAELYPIIDQRCDHLFKILSSQLIVGKIDVLNDAIPQKYMDATQDSIKYIEACYKIMQPIIEDKYRDDEQFDQITTYCKAYIAYSAGEILSTARGDYYDKFYGLAYRRFSISKSSLADSLRQNNPSSKSEAELSKEWLRILRSRKGLPMLEKPYTPQY